MMKCTFGPSANDGDYVIVVDFNYVSRRCKTLIGKVYKNKVYTGTTMDTKRDKYIHKISAEVVISKDIVPEETIKAIEEDITLHNKNYKEEV